MARERILLIDGFNIIISQNKVCNITDINCEPIGTYIGTINQIKIFTQEFKPQKIFFILDGPNAGERRRQMYSNYKGKRRITERKSKVVFNYDEDNVDTYEVTGAFEKQLSQIYEFLKLLPVTVCIIPYCEADDIITYIAKLNEDRYENIIISTDKDYLQLISDSIFVYNWRNKVLYTQNKFIDKFEILPSNYIFKKVIRGDSSDEIKGSKNIGEKTFLGLFSELKSKRLNDIGEFFDYIDSIDLSGLQKKYHKHIDLLKESKKDLLLKYNLMKLEVNNLKIHHIDLLKQQVKEQENKSLSKITLKIKMLNDNFHKLNSSGHFNYDQWSQPFMTVRQIDINF